ncbi:hypothetical protein M9H77_34274 [Catharanthus roseus]|uniref:Uncharacterized protein n=1 Tax=Catharanthus roseus TaxID=4058 RepID=A0ACB9ZMF4_CATRO|nr:hypothetical protein M9H77_34274 [Catharanthus roseus]
MGQPNTVKGPLSGQKTLKLEASEKLSRSSSSPTKVFLKVQIEESYSSSAVHQSSSNSIRFEKKLPSPQVNTLPNRRIGGLSYILGIPQKFCNNYYIKLHLSKSHIFVPRSQKK